MKTCTNNSVQLLQWNCFWVDARYCSLSVHLHPAESLLSPLPDTWSWKPHLVKQLSALGQLTLASQLSRPLSAFFSVVVYQSRFTFNNHLLNLYPLDSEASRAGCIKPDYGMPGRGKGSMCQVCHQVIYIPGWNICVVSWVKAAERGEKHSDLHWWRITGLIISKFEFRGGSHASALWLKLIEDPFSVLKLSRWTLRVRLALLKDPPSNAAHLARKR